MIDVGVDQEHIIEGLASPDSGISIRRVRGTELTATVLYIKPLTDSTALSDHVIRPLLQAFRENTQPPSLETLAEGVVTAADCTVSRDYEGMHTMLLAGRTVVIVRGLTGFLGVDLKQVEHKPVADPELTFTLRGPRDAFTEMLDTNLSLIRYRIKDPKLTFRMLEVGRRTKTRVAVAYISDIANDSYVSEVIDRIASIDTDGILESGELQAFMLNDKTDVFPQMGIIERSDSAANALLEGKVVVITEGSGIALVAPRTFVEYLLSCDDMYDNKYFGLLNKLLRITAIVMTLVMSSIYVAAVSFHSDVLAAEYILAVANMRSGVPFNALTEALLVEIITELLREALVRVPRQIGTAIGIVGAIIIGQAAVTAGIFSPLMLIIGSLSLLSSFAVPDYTLVNAIRILKFLLLLLTGTLGLLGLTMGLCLIATEVITTGSFGVPFFAPMAPFNRRDFKKSFLFNRSMAPRRPEFLDDKDKTRG